MHLGILCSHSCRKPPLTADVSNVFVEAPPPKQGFSFAQTQPIVRGGPCPASNSSECNYTSLIGYAGPPLGSMTVGKTCQ
jgi:hypothetical protein